MARTNRAAVNTNKTHEGAVAHPITAIQELRRSVMSCMLFESEFYESGTSIVERIAKLVDAVTAEELQVVAIEARSKFKLRHVPLLLAALMARKHKGKIVADTIAEVIQRADELCEFTAIVAKINGVKNNKVKKCLSAQAKKGLARAFNKFNEYQLAKYNRDTEVKLRDVLFMVHAKPENEVQDLLWKKLVENKLATPDTWETNLSAGANKADTFQRLMAEKSLGGLAFLRNLRNMQQAGVPKAVVAAYARDVNLSRVLPFRFIAAANAVPPWEDVIEPMMLRAVAEQEKLPGKTAILIDHSGSMEHALSSKSEMSRFDAAAALAILLREICEEVRIFTFSNQCIEVAPRRGFAMRDAVKSVINPVSTLLGRAVNHVYAQYPDCNRLIVVTDEQSQDRPGNPRGTGYVINVASAKNGVGYGAWNHIDGFSEAVIDWIREYENANTIEG